MGDSKLSGKPDEMLMRGGGKPFDGLASPPGGSSDTPSHFMLHGNWDKLWLGGPIGLSTDLTFIIEIPYMVKIVNC